MKNCANCGTLILFGGVCDGNRTYCGANCHGQATDSLRLLNIPDEDALYVAREIHEECCPVCGGSGPVDFHYSYRVTSYLAISYSSTIPRISCRSCASKARFHNGLLTFFMGWWGPGLLLTPFYLGYNLFGCGSPKPDDEPSQELMDHAKILIAQHIAMQREEAAQDKKQQPGMKR